MMMWCDRFTMKYSKYLKKILTFCDIFRHVLTTLVTLNTWHVPKQI